MSTALVVKGEQGLEGFPADKVDLIRKTVAQDATDLELQLFLADARRRGLDPLARQIYCIVRGDGKYRKATIQTSIDGYRLIADRTGRYAGSDDAVFEFANDGKLVKATVTVWKYVTRRTPQGDQDERCPFTASALWKEYAPDPPKNVWAKMPSVMLAKCAESLALRKAFPAELSGIYTAEEMAQAGDENVIDVQAQAPPPKPAARPPKATPAKPATDASFRERLNQPVPIRAEVVAEAVIEANATVIDVVAEPLQHDDLAEAQTALEQAVDRYDDLPDPPRPDAKFYDYDGDLPLWVVGPLICYERLVNNKPVLASVVYCAEHQKPFALRLSAANTAGWAHTTVQGQICNQYPVATISNPRTGEVLYDAGDQFPLDG